MAVLVEDVEVTGLRLDMLLPCVYPVEDDGSTRLIEFLNKGVMNMGLDMFEVAAATAAVGYDLLTDRWIAESPYYRKVNRIAVTGSAAAMDTKLDLYYGDRLVAQNITNCTTGYPTSDHFKTISGNMLCRPTEKLRLVVTDAAATNPVEVVIETCDYPRMRQGAGGYRRRY